MKSVLAIALLVCACGSNRAPAPPVPIAPLPASVPAPPEARGPSLYALDLPLHDQDGAAQRLDGFRGHPTLVAMFYTSCPTACPMMIETMRDVEAALPADARDDLRVLLVSFDPAHDDAAALTGVAVAHHVDRARWRLATASDDDVRVLAGALDVHYRSEAGRFVHSTTIALLDGDGRIASRTEDLATARRDLPAAIRALTVK